MQWDADATPILESAAKPGGKKQTISAGRRKTLTLSHKPETLPRRIEAIPEASRKMKIISEKPKFMDS